MLRMFWMIDNLHYFEIVDVIPNINNILHGNEILLTAMPENPLVILGRQQDDDVRFVNLWQTTSFFPETESAVDFPLFDNFLGEPIRPFDKYAFEPLFSYFELVICLDSMRIK